MMNQTQIGIHPFKTGILNLEFFHSGQLTYTQSTILGFPIIKGGITDSMFPTDILNLLSLLLSVEYGYDLGFAKT